MRVLFWGEEAGNYLLLLLSHSPGESASRECREKRNETRGEEREGGERYFIGD